MNPQSHHAPRWRATTAGLLGSLALILIFAGSFFSLGNRAVFHADFFADHVAASLSDQRVASYVATKITDAVVAESEDLIMVRPLIEATAEAAVASPPFRAVVRAGARRSHQLLATRGGHDILLSVSDFSVILRHSLASRPDLADRIPDDAVAVMGAVGDGPLVDFSGELLHLGQRFGTRARLIFWFGMALLTASVLVANERETALLRAGIALIVSAAVTLVILELGQLVVARIPADPALGQALAGVWNTFAGGLRTGVFLLGGIGLLLAAAATASLEVMNLAAIGDRLRALVVAPTERRGLRLARGLTLAVVGWIAIQNPLLVARSLIVAGGGVLVFVGLRELCRLVVDPAVRLARKADKLETGGKRRRVTWGRFVLMAAGAAVILGAVYLMTRAPLPAVDQSGNRQCNGLDVLRDRPLNEVVFACTHNAMGAADVSGWLFPNQQRGVRRQLEDGIRALMLDVVPGIPIGDAVKTDFDEAEIVREKLEPSLGVEGFEAALRIRGRLLGGDPKDRDLFLCHALCELGAIRLVPLLREIREFLLLNPREVLIIIVEDAVPAGEVAAAFEESRLVDLVYRGPVTPPWPTLGEMVDRGERVLVLAENDSEGVPWYHPAFAVCQETPYHFESPDELSNEPNRGGTAGSLLLLNHWITTVPAPMPSNAQVVNSRAALMTRIEQCRRERGRLPNIIAVDFYRTGDLLEVVDELNRAAGDPIRR